MGLPRPAWVTWMREGGRIPELGGQGGIGAGFGTGGDFEGAGGDLGDA